MAKARVSGEALGKGNRKIPRGRRGRHVAKDHQRKLRTTRGLPRPGENRHSEGILYKPQGGEIGMRRRVGRMGSVKRRWPGQHNPAGARTPGVERITARMEVRRRPHRP